jgi:hypothetical protein
MRRCQPGMDFSLMLAAGPEPIISGNSISSVFMTESPQLPIAVYGDANAYLKVLVANEPMLVQPNRVSAREQLRIC